ncbi:hypothetical protein J437_LFUL004281, partial [Ladona fulva]
MRDAFSEVQERCRDLILTDEKLLEVKHRLELELRRGLSKEEHPNSSVKCFITYVTDLPNGTAEAPPVFYPMRCWNVRNRAVDFVIFANLWRLPKSVQSNGNMPIWIIEVKEKA